MSWHCFAHRRRTPEAAAGSKNSVGRTQEFHLPIPMFCLGHMGVKLRHLRSLSISVLACMLLAVTSNTTMAGSLAGSQGDKRFPPVRASDPNSPCNKAWKRYVAASGHSAYATTPYARVRDIAIICGLFVNAKTQAAAEQRALANCTAGLSQYKLTLGGRCEIAASK